MADHAGHCSSSSQDRRSHFLVAAYGYQGHLNPALALARSLARPHGGGARVTLSVAASAHARMFPSSPPDQLVVSPPDAEVSDGVISYVPYSDGFDFGARPRTAADRARRRRVSAASLSAIVRRLAAAGRPVTCVVSVLLLPAADVAVEHGIPLAVFWNQSAATLAAYYHYFHGHEHLVAAAAAAYVGGADDPASVTLPGLPPLRVRDLPSFLVDATGGEHARASIDSMRGLLEIVGREKPMVLVNTIDMLEPEAVALRAMRQQHLEVFAVGPMLPRLQLLQQTDAAGDDEGRRMDLYEQDDEKGYTEWLDARPRRSVVYVSYGSMLGYSRQQVQEMLRGLRECRRPYLWVVPRDGRDGDVERCLMEMDDDDGDGERGMVMEWCDQLKVLAHPSTGCFVTHCGWNSMLEALVFGVPMVAVPNWSDQPVNAHLVEELGVGVRAERDAAGLLVGTELAKFIAVVTGDGDEGMNIRNRASLLKDKARKEVIESGLTESRLQKFVNAMQNSTSSEI
ncbi:cyanidin 3-O-rutinoside 5-O-glucosyltransferase-like [Miscanthus floridulus]|uniref:cyanidin 3-O-rutinoside 5-O-glucosyltransferase-like n=1 Tax=Miscanthus floridulus TaxID=154761 RepID=UPI00345933FD